MKVIDIQWPTAGQGYTEVEIDTTGTDEVYAGKFTVPANAAPSSQLGRVFATQAHGETNRIQRYACLSLTAGDFDNPIGKYDDFNTATYDVQAFFSIGKQVASGYGVVTPGQTVYLNVKNKNASPGVVYKMVYGLYPK